MEEPETNPKKTDEESTFPNPFEEGAPEYSPDQLPDLPEYFPVPNPLDPLAESMRPSSTYRVFGVNGLS